MDSSSLANALKSFATSLIPNRSSTGLWARFADHTEDEWRIVDFMMYDTCFRYGFHSIPCLRVSMSSWKPFDMNLPAPFFPEITLL